MKRSFLITLCILLLLQSCQSGTGEKTTRPETGQEIKDLHSFANFNNVQVTHLDLDIAVDFDKKQLAGVAHWMFENKTGDSVLILDTEELHVDSVILDDGSKAAFSFGIPKPYMGRALKIFIRPDSKKVSVYYNTLYNPADTFVALQWLAPAQTLGKKAPFLYTQSEPDFARSWYPCQDAPSVKFTYNATIKVPKGLMAVMSAVNPQQHSEEGVYTFSMKQKISSYLVALAVGDIAFKPVDSRTGVYAEPAMLDKAASEFSELPQMLEAAEKLCGTYDWDRYDVLVLPPGFPIGGMENPRLTFATPTIIAGDKSLVSLIAHELAHSWSGNLVTNATWNDLWLNEGFTVYFERRIIEAIRGKDYTDMLWTIGFQDLEAAFDDFKEEEELTQLKLNLEGRDPAISLSDVAYEKGALFLWSVEKAVGRERFDAFLKEYFRTYRFRSITTEDFIQFLEVNLLKGNAALEAKVKYKDWIYKEGLPEGYPRPGNVKFKAVEQQLHDFETSMNAEKLKTGDWSTHEWLHFLRKMSVKTDARGMAVLDTRFRFSESTNSEIACAWFINAIRRNYSPAYAPMERFLFMTGRQKFLQPLYEEMMKQPATVDLARDIYRKSKDNYHPIASQSIGKIVSQ